MIGHESPLAFAAYLSYRAEQMREVRLGEFEQIVLLAVLRLGEGAYGVPIQLEIEKRAERRVTVGALCNTRPAGIQAAAAFLVGRPDTAARRAVEAIFQSASRRHGCADGVQGRAGPHVAGPPAERRIPWLNLPNSPSGCSDGW